MKFTWIALAFLVSSSFGAVALAADSCVQQATNYELINELSRRLGGSGPTSGAVTVSFLCGGNAQVMATAVNLTTGNSTQISVATGDWDRCRSTADLLTSKIGTGNPLSGGRLFAVCGGNAQIFKIAILVDGTLKQVSADATGDWNVCYKTADTIDAALQP